MSVVPRIIDAIDAIEAGHPKAAEELLPLVYDELRRLATARMANESPGQTLQPTALVHEAWMKLAGDRHDWNGRAHFFGAAAEAMRRILIDKSRRKAALKRGEAQAAAEFSETRFEIDAPSEEILAVHEALDGLAESEPLAAQVVKLRYFVGMTNKETAETLGMSPRTANRYWDYARSWLHRAIRDAGGD